VRKRWWSGRRYVLSVLTGLFALLLVGLGIAQDQETLQIRTAVAAEDPHSPGYVAALVGAGVSYGNSYRVLLNGKEVYPAMLDAIQRARRRISFETYVYEDGEVAERFTAALEHAARRGVEVRLVVDLIGGAAMGDGHLERLSGAGVKVATLNAPRWFELEEVNYRTHRKILVVDGEVGFSGGIGVSDYWFHTLEGRPPWRDTHVMMRGPIVRLLEAAFYENLIESGGVVTPALDQSSEQADTDGASLLLRGAPTGGANDLKRLYLVMLGMARRSIDIATPYFVTDESTLWAFREAAARDVKIRILVESDRTDALPVKYASRDAYDALLSLGIEIYEYLPTMMHAKVMVVDGIWSMFGSANFDNRSLELNDELNIAVFSAELASRFQHDFENDLRVSKRLSLDEWRQRPLTDKVREHFWSYFGEVF
jgi:cardiolipin synthase